MPGTEGALEIIYLDPIHCRIEKDILSGLRKQSRQNYNPELLTYSPTFSDCLM